MTNAYQRLLEGPQTGITRSQLNFDERRELRTIQVRGTTGLVQTNNPGKFTSVYYLVGDERAAETASLAVDLLARMDERKRAAGVNQWHAGLSLD